MAGDMIDFWFSTGSTYTYLAVSRLEKVAAAEGVRFNWRPFSVRTIMRDAARSRYRFSDLIRFRAFAKPGGGEPS